VNKRQKITVFAPIALWVSMYLVYRQLAYVYGSRFAWYTGFWIYWLVWCAVFSFWVAGKEEILRLIRPRRPNIKIILLVTFPLILTAIFRVVTGTQYVRPDALWTVLLISTAFGNGFFEEVLWRGMYYRFFSTSTFFGIIWPACWFALWHYIPGSLSPNSNAIGLMVGAGLFGLYLGFLARKTGTIWWCIVCHSIGGIMMVV
jgi:membrane protease YdiL (CAAX protease family)